MVHVCGIIPPSLLKGIANSEVNEESIREEAQVSLEHHHQLSAHRYHRSCIHAEAHAAQNGSQPTNSFIPENILNQLQMTTAADGTAQQSTKLNPTLLALQVQQDQQVASVTEKVSARFVYNALNTMNDAGLPGTLTRIDGQSQVEDSAINQAFDNIGIVMQFYKDLFGWSGLDNQNGDVKGSVHVGRHMQNAYWNGKQMLFGDGGNYISNFTNCLDVIAHELTHAVTAHTTALVYEGQSGALNEHISDVFGIMVKHRAMNITVDKADWLLGEGCLLPGVKGVAVRSMKAPGTAYDDPRFVSERAKHSVA